ncbi:MAG: PH domain-containing protein [Pseudomonadota bacterium]
MGRYIDEILQPGEQVLYSTTLHGVIYLPAVLGWVAALGCFIMERRAQTDGGNLIWLVLTGLAALVALYWSVRAWFQRWTTETDVTTLRVVHKEGFIQRSTFEMNLDKVESVDVNQSIPGRILGYGDVTIFGVGEGRKTIGMIASPLQFRNHITAR